jgi:hypothetical protein
VFFERIRVEVEREWSEEKSVLYYCLDLMLFKVFILTLKCKLMSFSNQPSTEGREKKRVKNYIQTVDNGHLNKGNAET